MYLYRGEQVDLPDGAGQSKIRVNVKHDLHGMFSVQSAEMMKEKVRAYPRMHALAFCARLSWSLEVGKGRADGQNRASADLCCELKTFRSIDCKESYNFFVGGMFSHVVHPIITR